MGEIIILYFLTRHIGHLVSEKGYSSLGYKIITIIVWFGLEFLGGYIGSLIGGFFVIYSFGLLFVGVGVTGLYLYFRNMEDYDETQDFKKITIEDDELIVYQHISKNSTPLLVLHKGDLLSINLETDFGDFHKVLLPNSKDQMGYILKSTNFTTLHTNQVK